MTADKGRAAVYRRIISLIVGIGLLLCVFGHNAAVFAAYYDEPVLDAYAAAGFDYRTGSVLYKKKSLMKISPGSLTAVMVAVTAADIKKVEGDLKENIGEMLDSCTDAKVDAVIKSCGVSEEKFLERMNKVADGLGCENTVFRSVYCNGRNTTAEDSSSSVRDGNSTTMKDLCTIGEAFLDNSALRSIAEPDKEKDDMKYRILAQGNGGSRGQCSFIFAEKGESSFGVFSVGGASKEISVEDSLALLSYLFDNYRTYQVLSVDKSAGKIKVKGGEKNYVKVYAKEDLYINLPKEGEDSLVQTEIVLDKDIVPPVKKNTVVGKAQALEAGEVTAEVPVVVKEDVKAGGPWSRIGISDHMMIGAGAAVVALLLLTIILRIRKARRRRKIAAARRKRREAEIMRIAAERYERKRRGWDD